MSVEAVASSNAGSPAEIASALPENKRDRETERQILDFLSAPGLGNKVFTYSYDHRPWEIRIISNPERKNFVPAEGNIHLSMMYSLISRDKIPSELETHLIGMIEQKLGTKNGYISLGSSMNGKPAFDLYANVRVTASPPFNAIPIETPRFGTKIALPVLKPPSSSEQQKTKIEMKQPVKGPDIAVVQPTKIPSFREQQEARFDLKTEEQIRALFKTSEFAKQTFKYNYGGTNYDLLVIHNPQRQPMAAEGIEGLKRWSFVVALQDRRFPVDLPSRLESLTPKEGKDSKDYLMEFIVRNFDYGKLSTLEPVEVNVDGNRDASFDEKIWDCFSSKELVNRVFYYTINGKDYKVRIIHNPEKARLTATQQINTFEYKGPMTLTRSERYGILVDKPAPKELIDQLTNLTNAGWWDWYFSFYINNGGKVFYFDGEWKYTIDISTCDFLSSLKKA
jgi:hypothetical protein